MRFANKVRLGVGVAAATGIAVVGLSAGTASADPLKGDPLELSCEGGLEVEAVVFSNGQWSPALDTESNAVYHPVAFENQYFEVRDDGGNVLFSDSPPDVAKNGKRLGQDLIECDYFSSFEAFDPEVGPIFGEASGTVFGFVSG
jgi:hypothetical protein